MKSRYKKTFVAKRTIQDVIARYTVEPELKDLYVEGTTDEKLLEWFLAEKGKEDIFVYQIDLVDIPSELVVEKHGLDGTSKRARLMVLSRELSQKLPRNTNVICIVDLDFDTYLTKKTQNSFIEYTDYAAMEIYMFKERIIGKFLNLVLNGFPIPVARLIKLMLPILTDLFVIRLANETLGWKMTFMDYKKKKYITISLVKPGMLDFDENAFVKNYLIKNGKSKSINDYQNTIKKIKDKLLPDFRYNVRGHDFTELFFYIAHKENNNLGISDVSAFEGALRACLTTEDLENEGLFQKILSL